MGLVGNILDSIHKEVTKSKNKRKMEKVVKMLFQPFLSHLVPYFVTILVILIVMFVLDCVQFYYYLKVIRQTSGAVDVFTVVE